MGTVVVAVAYIFETLDGVIVAPEQGFKMSNVNVIVVDAPPVVVVPVTTIV
jgi:hypothetical protein